MALTSHEARISTLLVCLGERRERRDGTPPRHARPPAPQGSVARSAAWIRRAAPHRADLARPPANPAGLPLSSTLSARASGPDRRRVGGIGEQPQGEVLPPDRRGQTALQGGGGVLAAALRGHRVRAEGAAGGCMRLPARLRTWIRASFRRRDFERSMQDEMQLHVDLYEADLRRRGVPDAEAHRRARAEFGSVAARTDECREAVSLRLFDELRADVRFALRLLRQSPTFTFVALLSLGLGIGANTAIFSLVDTVLVKFLPVADPQHLFFVDNSGGKSGGGSGPPYPCYEALRDHNRFLAGIAAFHEGPVKVTIDGTPEQVLGQYASGSYFDVLGVKAVHGRVLTPRDDSVFGRGGPDGAVAVISHALWARRFGLDPAVLGKAVQVGTDWVTIVGVTPPDFFGLQVGSPIDITVPIMLQPNNLRSKHLWWMSVVGRLKPDASVAQARGVLETLFDAYMNEIGITLE